MSSSKKYGLIVPEKTKSIKPVFQASRNIFGNDSESDEESSKKPVLLRPSDNINRQAKIARDKAIDEDPTVFQYDEVYDEIKNERDVKKEKKKEDKKPKYIENLLKTANKRKIENERRIERQIQKEREQEGDEFADKEVFVTTAYKKKLEELKLEEEKEKREEYLESIGDVTKQKDLGGFYRHLYEQKLGKVDKDKDTINKNDSIAESSADKNKTNKKEKGESPGSPLLKKRNYRKRKASNDINKDLSEGEIEESDEEINRLNLDDIRMAKKHKKENIDADSDFSIDDSSDEDDTVKAEDIPSVTKKNSYNKENIKEVKEPSDMASIVDEKNGKDTTTVVTPPKPKIDIWKKRTVGVVFDEALKRYYERKASRGF